MPNKKRILLAEDEDHLLEAIKLNLELEGYKVSTATNGKKALQIFKEERFNLVILDVMMPEIDGFVVAETIRLENSEVPIMFLTAKNTNEDKISGLKKGADDYLTKPFHLAELHARIRAIYRRKNLGGAHIVRFNEISLNTDTLEARVGDALLDTTRKEFDLLLYFLVNKNRVLSRQSIAAHLWGDYTDNLANFDFVYQHVKNLRRKIGSAGGKDYITTVYGLGYKFKTPGG
jgi:DNA-binding response OmpR family regulator